MKNFKKHFWNNRNQLWKWLGA